MQARSVRLTLGSVHGGLGAGTSMGLTARRLRNHLRMRAIRAP